MKVAGTVVVPTVIVKPRVDSTAARSEHWAGCESRGYSSKFCEELADQRVVAHELCERLKFLGF
jgi:hypothetical protein